MRARFRSFALLAAAPLTFTTSVTAEHFGGNVQGLSDYESTIIALPRERTMTVTAVPAHHGPERVRAIGGPVAGFVLSGRDIPTVYISGDNSDVELVRERVGKIDIALRFAGGA